MQNKIYSSFDQINEELKLLKLQKEINTQSFALTFEKTKENIHLDYFKQEVFVYIKERLSDSYRGILMIAIPYILKFIKRKRGM